MTVVAGPDPVTTSFLNFMAVQDDTAKVGWAQGVILGRRALLAESAKLSESLCHSRLFSTPNSNHLLTEQSLSTHWVSYPVLGMGVGCNWVSPSIPHSPPPSAS